MTKEFERLERHRKLESLANVVLLNNDVAESSQDHLEEKIRNRLDKEFPNPSPEEAQIINGLKEKTLHFVPREIKRHRNTECFVQVQQDIREKDVHLFYKFRNPLYTKTSDNHTIPYIDGDLMQLFITLDSLLRAGMKSVTLYAPFIPYLRQDKKDDGRVPITAKLLFNLLETSSGGRLKRIVTVDLHAQQEQGFFDGPLDELPAMPEFAAYYKELFKDSEDGTYCGHDIETMAVDSGGVKRTAKMAELMKTPWNVFEKLRTAHSEAATRLEGVRVMGGKKVIIAEDMIDTCGSIAGEEEKNRDGPIQYLIKRGAEVYVCAAHTIFSRKNNISAEQRLRNSGAKVLVTDSIPERYSGYFEENKDWLTVISLDYVLAKTFYCNQVGESISGFLESREHKLKGDKLDFKISNEGPTYSVEED